MCKVLVSGRVYIGCFQKLGGFPPKWMVKIMENSIKKDDLGGFPIFLVQHPYWVGPFPK